MISRLRIQYSPRLMVFIQIREVQIKILTSAKITIGMRQDSMIPRLEFMMLQELFIPWIPDLQILLRVILRSLIKH